MLIKGIDKLWFFFPMVELINVKGNHDEMSVLGIMQTLAAFYKYSNKVKINTDSRFRQYIRYGVNLIGLSHNERVQDANKIILAETRRDWGETKYHTFIMGIYIKDNY